MDFLQAQENQILVGVAVAVVAIGLGAVYLYSSKKTKGFTFFNFMLYPFEILCFYFDLCIRVFFFLVLHVREDPTCFFFFYFYENFNCLLAIELVTDCLSCKIGPKRNSNQIRSDQIYYFCA